MYVFQKNGKSWTCPDASIICIARIQAEGKEMQNEDEAVKYMETCGFEVTKVSDPGPLTEVPKIPQWNNRAHRDLYDKLFYHDIGRELTPEENDFCKTMYHMEEYACGLDGI